MIGVVIVLITMLAPTSRTKYTLAATLPGLTAKAPGPVRVAIRLLSLARRISAVSLGARPVTLMEPALLASVNGAVIVPPLANVTVPVVVRLLNFAPDASASDLTVIVWVEVLIVNAVAAVPSIARFRLPKSSTVPEKLTGYVLRLGYCALATLEVLQLTVAS